LTCPSLAKIAKKKKKISEKHWGKQEIDTQTIKCFTFNTVMENSSFCDKKETPSFTNNWEDKVLLIFCNRGYISLNKKNFPPHCPTQVYCTLARKIGTGYAQNLCFIVYTKKFPPHCPTQVYCTLARKIGKGYLCILYLCKFVAHVLNCQSLDEAKT